MKTIYFFMVVLLALLALAGGASASANQAAAAPQGGGLMFIENIGQFDPQVRFQAQTANGTLWVANDGLWVTMQNEQQGVALKLSFVGANPQPGIEPFDLLETKFSYFLGNDPAKWVSDAPVWAGVRYVDLYPGIDLVLAGREGQLAPRLAVRDAGHLSEVNLRVDGAASVTTEAGQMLLDTAIGRALLPLLAVEAMGELAQPGVTSLGDSSFVVTTPLAVESDTGAMPLQAAQAQATTVFFSTYLGGTNDEWSTGVAMDAIGNSYVCGGTMSNPFPIGPGYDIGHNGGVDVFVAKYDTAGQMLAGTFLGGGGYDSCGQVQFANNAVYLTGQAQQGFPTPGGYDQTYEGGWDAFVAKLNNNLSALSASTYLGGDRDDRGLDIEVGADGNVYIAGDTYGNFLPTTGGTAQPNYGGGRDGFVAKLNLDLSARLWATYLGGFDYEEAVGLAFKGGSIYVTGVTRSPNYPTWNPYNRDLNGGEDGFVTKLNSNGHLVYSTYLGGKQNDWLNDIVVDGSNQAHVVGVSSSGDYPADEDDAMIPPYQSKHKAGQDVVLTVLNAAGTGLVYSTFLGGNGLDAAGQIAIDASGYDYVFGWTQSTDLLAKPDLCAKQNPGSDAFLAKLQTRGVGEDLPLVYGTYLGGSATDMGLAIALDSHGYALLSGTTESESPDFCPRPPANNSYKGARDVFVTKLAPPASSFDGGQNLLGFNGWAWKPDTIGVNGAPTNGILSINVLTAPARACWYQDIDGAPLRNQVVRFEAEMRKTALMNQVAPPFTNPYISLQVRKGDGSWLYNFGGVLNSRSVPGGGWVSEARDILLPNDMTTLRAAFCVWNATQGRAEAQNLLLRRAVEPPPPPSNPNLLSSDWTWTPASPGLTGPPPQATGVFNINVAQAGARGCWIQDLPGAPLRNKAVRFEGTMKKSTAMNAGGFGNPYISLQVRQGNGAWWYNFPANTTVNSTAVPGGDFVTNGRNYTLPQDMVTLRAAFCVWDAAPGLATGKNFLLQQPVAAQSEESSAEPSAEGGEPAGPDTPSVLPEDAVAQPESLLRFWLPLIHN